MFDGWIKTSLFGTTGHDNSMRALSLMRHLYVCMHLRGCNNTPFLVSDVTHDSADDGPNTALLVLFLHVMDGRQRYCPSACTPYTINLGQFGRYAG
jgi:hypothetical protein